MTDEKNQQPQDQQPVPRPEMEMGTEQGGGENGTDNHRKQWYAAAGIIIVLVVIAAAFFAIDYFKEQKTTPEGSELSQEEKLKILEGLSRDEAEQMTVEERKAIMSSSEGDATETVEDDSGPLGEEESSGTREQQGIRVRR